MESLKRLSVKQVLPRSIDIRNTLPAPSSGRPESIRQAGEDVSL